MLVDTDLPLTADKIRLLPPAVRRRFAGVVGQGPWTVGNLLQQLNPSERAAVLEALTPLPPGVSDLLHLPSNDLLASVGLPPDPKLGWYPASLTLAGDAGATKDARAQVREALRIRSERRARGAEVEEDLRARLRAFPPPPLTELAQSLTRARDELRRRTVPEAEFDTLDQWKLDAPRELVVWSGGGRSAAVGVLDDLQLPVTPDRWFLAAVDRTLHALTTPGHPLRAELEQLHARPRWARELERLDKSLGAPPATAELGFRFVGSDYGEWTIRPVSCVAKPKGGFTVKALKTSEHHTVRKSQVEARALALITGWRHGLPNELAATVAEMLAGQPRLFSGSKGTKPLAVRRRTLALQLGVEDGEVAPTYSVDGEPVDLADVWATREGPTWIRLYEEPDADELQLIEVVDQMFEVASWMARTGSLPMDAVPALVERLPALGRHVPVDLDPSLRGEALPPDLRPVVRVGWDGHGLTLDVRLRHLPELPPVEPGTGLAELVTSRDGKADHVPRDLEREPAAVEQALEPLALPEAARSGWRW
ncbi:MAG: hypothetical protein ABMA64_42625, partial [Myxococcota bacterium]